MLRSIEELLQFHRQRFHIDINLVRESLPIGEWNNQGILIGIPWEAGSVLELNDLIFQQDGAFNQFPGNPIILEEKVVGLEGDNFILFNACPLNEPAVRFIRNFLDGRIPKMAREIRKKSRSAFLNGMLGTERTRKSELVEAIKEDSYQLDDLIEQVNKLSRRAILNKKMLAFFDHPEDIFKRDMLRMLSELMKLVPGNYSCIRFEDGKIIGLTQPIVIVHEGHAYDFEPYEVKFDLNTQTIHIRGDKNEVNTYIHPHVTGGGSICWGNIGGLVAKLSGELDIYGLFQLLHTFLSTYNEDDPYQKIERWDPSYVEDDDDGPYCRWCDETGHDISECEWCWWCEACEDYCDHDEENCPSRQTDETEEEEVKDDDLVAEPA